VLSDGEFTRIKVPGALLTVAQGINDHGDIVGIFTNDGGRFHGFLLSHGRFRTIDVPGVVTSIAWRINNSGEIVGITEGTAERGFLLSQGEFVTIAVPGAASTQATGINDKGEIVGAFIDNVGQHGFVTEFLKP
jgi:probable HAF family extracellular repeat protein